MKPYRGDAVDAPGSRLDGEGSKLVYWKMSLPTAGGLQLGDF